MRHKPIYNAFGDADRIRTRENEMNNAATKTTAASGQVWEKKSSYSHPEILAFARREFGGDLPPLPLPPMLMLHRVTEISEVGGKNKKGYAVAEYDVSPDDWYFPCHFKGNPLMPGALGFDGVMQLTGFFLVWLGARGDGMALGFEGGKFRGKVSPDSKLLRLRVDIVQVRLSGHLKMIKADGEVTCDGKTVQEMKGFSVGVSSKK